MVFYIHYIIDTSTSISVTRTLQNHTYVHFYVYRSSLYHRYLYQTMVIKVIYPLLWMIHVFIHTSNVSLYHIEVLWFYSYFYRYNQHTSNIVLSRYPFSIYDFIHASMFFKCSMEIPLWFSILLIHTSKYPNFIYPIMTIHYLPSRYLQISYLTKPSPNH